MSKHYRLMIGGDWVVGEQGATPIVTPASEEIVGEADSSRAYALAQHVRSGVVGINTAQIHPEAPCGGCKRSGVGRDRGDVGLHAYTGMQSLVW